MNATMPRILAACSILLNLCAFVVFGMWLLKLRIVSNAGDYGFHVAHRGPPEWLIAALVLAILGVLATGAYLIVLMRSRRAAPEPSSRWPRVLAGLAILGITAPALAIVPCSVWQLPAAQKQAREEAVREAPFRKPLKDLNDEEYVVRRDAAVTLATAPWIPESAIPALMKAAARNDGEPSSFAILALGHFLEHADEVVPTLVELLDKPELGPQAGEVLGKFGKPGVDALMRATKSENAQARASAAHGLGSATQPETAVIPRLMGLLHDEDSSVRAMAAMSLGAWGVKAEPALPALRAMANDPDSNVRSQAEFAANDITGRLGSRE